MTLFGDGFDAEDAFTIGGAMGFAEESMKAEEEGLFDEQEGFWCGGDAHARVRTNPEAEHQHVPRLARVFPRGEFVLV